ncbi:hypothetical protein JQ616_39005 [Bradyrhizobium tropiciagri]|uniref:hypothetical protein n=1 Tax=Bradyrhizobium tropiciagri TaxID=312253 RepID=UPI001BAD13DD|nr:hypothetical protein [Bradyrhizobium tropiciagri]MBR0900982.1 hypothetical protein [Bradyrhizobium tropiciagri]
MQELETTIDALTKRGEQLAIKRVAAQAAADKAIKARQHALLSADLNDRRTLDKVQSAALAASVELAAIDDAIAVLDRQKAEAKRELAAERDRVDRAAAADKLTNQVDAIKLALPQYLEHSRVLADALSGISDWHFESDQIAKFAQNTVAQIEVAANFALSELAAMPDAIRDGRQAIPGAALVSGIPPVELVVAPQIELDPVLRAANFTEIDRRDEARSIQIEVPRT